MTGPELALLFGTGVVAAVLQATSGFGGALVTAPALFAVLRPAEAVLASALMGVVQSAAIAGRGRASIRRDDLWRLLLPAAPGLVAGALVLRVASGDALRVGVGVAIIVATLVRVTLPLDLPPRAAYPVGFLAGALTTSVTVNGPPMVLYLQARGATPPQMRATLAGAFLALDSFSAAALAVTGTLDAPPLSALLALLLALPVGLAIGIPLAHHVEGRAYDGLAVALLLVLATVSIAGGLGLL